MKSYSVSLIYTKKEPSSIDIALRCCICMATSKEEALGSVINQVSREMKGYSMSNHAVIDVNHELAEITQANNSGKPYDDEVPDEERPPEQSFESDDIASVLSEDNIPIVEKVKETRESKRSLLPEPRYLSESTVEAIKGEGKEMFLPGIQAQQNKFIVAGAYIKGRLSDARKKYTDYFNAKESHSSILSWESWITLKYMD